MLTVQFNNGKRRLEILRLLTCRTAELDAVNKLNDRTSAWWDNFVIEIMTGEFSDEPNIALKIS